MHLPRSFFTSLFFSLSAVTAARTSIHATVADTSRVPLLSYQYPKSTLGHSSFNQLIGTVIFMPKLHPCGTLLILSAEGIQMEDLNKLAANSTEDHNLLMIEWNKVPELDRIVEDDAYESYVVAYAKGWRRTCGRGEHMKEVRLATLDLSDDLDNQLTSHISGLPTAPHPHTVVLTSLSQSNIAAINALLAAPLPPVKSTPNKDTVEWTDPDGSKWRSETRYRYKLKGGATFFFILLLVSLILYGAYRTWVRRIRKIREAAGAIMLPLDGAEDELDG